MQIRGLGPGRVMVIVALVGCGSSSGSTGTGGGTGSGGSFTTSVPSETKVTALTPAQAAQLCSDLESYADSNLFPAFCRETSAVVGPEAAYFDLIENPSASTAELRAACTSAADMDAGSSCTADLADAGTASCDFSMVPSTCQATVGDFTTCFNDMNAADLQQYSSVPSCSTLTAASVMAYFAADGGASANPPEPASCSRFDSTCDVDGGTSITSAMSRRMMPRGR